MTHRMLAGFLVAAACGGGTIEEQPGPRGLRASQHEAAADREQQRADELGHWPDTRPSDGRNPAEALVVNGWNGTWDTVADHDRLARWHRSEAAELEAEYEQACGDTPAAIVSESPLQRFGTGGIPVPGGIVVVLSPAAGAPDALLAAMRCHRAWMMLGRTEMDDCPLDLPGLHVDAHGDATGIALTLTVSDPSLVDELRRRAAHDLETAARSRTPR